MAEPKPAPVEGPPLSSIDVYGAFIVVSTEEGETQKDAGVGKVVARGPTVVNFPAGSAIAVGQDILFRGGSTVKFGKGENLVFVAMADVMGLVAPAEVEPQT